MQLRDKETALEQYRVMTRFAHAGLVQLGPLTHNRSRSNGIQ